MEASQGEQSADQRRTSEQIVGEQGRADKEKMTGYKPVTLRARENTRWFFDRIRENEEHFGIGTADAVERTLLELAGEQKSTGELREENAALQTKIDELTSERDKLLQLTEQDQGIHLADDEHIIKIDPKVLKVLNHIAKKRFENVQVRSRYKLDEAENVGQLLLNCLFTQEILLNYNECFYTGYSREQMEEHRRNRS